jgi:hypothetical protein
MIIKKHNFIQFCIGIFLTICLISLSNQQNFLDYKFYEGFYSVKLVIYSGTPDPTFTIPPTIFTKIEKLLSEGKYRPKKSTRVIGYKGFVIVPLGYNTIEVNVRGNPKAEFMLLEIIKKKLPENVYAHILQEIGNGYEINSDGEVPAYSYVKIKNSIRSGQCDHTPIKGSDSVPSFDPKSDDQGCFEEKQWDNNCYNYGNDIVTNSFAQPGRGTGHKWEANTCEDVKKAAIYDGLEWVGTEYPSKKPEHGHYIALLIWPGTNFHWVRLDSNGMWSHKPGGTEITNKDNNGESIKDPASQDFSPWSEFCGYFNTQPSKVNIN